MGRYVPSQILPWLRTDSINTLHIFLLSFFGPVNWEMKLWLLANNIPIIKCCKTRNQCYNSRFIKYDLLKQKHKKTNHVLHHHTYINVLLNHQWYLPSLWMWILAFFDANWRSSWKQKNKRLLQKDPKSITEVSTVVTAYNTSSLKSIRI